MKKTIQRLLALALVTMTIIGMTGCNAAASTGDVADTSAPAVTEPAVPAATESDTPAPVEYGYSVSLSDINVGDTVAAPPDDYPDEAPVFPDDPEDEEWGIMADQDNTELTSLDEEESEPMADKDNSLTTTTTSTTYGFNITKGDKGNGSSGTTTGKATTEKDLKPYGTVETVIKSVSNPTKPDSKDTSMSNSYGTVDWSTAAQGYITFTAKGQTRIFILQGPNTGVQANMEVAKDETIKVALTDGTGKYQYAIANITNGGKTYRVQYKNSFTVSKIDSDLAGYLVSTPWGDFENAPNAVKKADELWDNSKSQLDNIKALADWVGDLKYDKKLAHGTIDVYVNPDDVIELGGGVCNDVSKLLIAMLRAKGVPAYYTTAVTPAGKNHAWVRAWVEIETSTKNGITYSKGAWVNLEATSGALKTKSVFTGYDSENLNYAN